MQSHIQSLALLFAPDDEPAVTETKQQEHYRVANMLVTLCITIGEMPVLRHDARPNASSVASILQTKLNDIAAMPGSPFPSRGPTESDRPMLLLIDRSHDVLTPLMHEYTYQAMMHDVLRIVNDRYKYHYVGNNNQQITKEVLLNDADPLLRRLRHLHVAELTTLLHAEYKKLLQDHKLAADLSKKGQDVKSMAEGLRRMPRFQEETARYSLHIHLTSELVRKYNECSLEQVSEIEQNMATGEDANRKPYRSALPDLKALLLRTDLVLSTEDKMRLLMMYVITQDGIKLEERKYLMDIAAIQPEDQVAILNLFYLGVTLLQGTGPRKKRDTKKDARSAESTYDVSRYIPPLKCVLEGALSNSLSAAEFPSVSLAVGCTDSASDQGRVGKLATWVASGGKPTKTTSTDTTATESLKGSKGLIVFMLGGLTYSELRAAHEVGSAFGQDIVIGSTAMLTPQTFLTALKNLKHLMGI